MKITVPHGLAGVAAAALCAATLGACGSGNGPSASANSTTVPSTTAPSTTIPSTTTAGNSTVQANTVCSDIKSAVTALKSINFNSSSSIQSNANAVASDIGRLNNDVNSSSAAPAGSPVQKMDNDVKAAINQGENAASQLSKGNAGNAETGFQQMTTDLNNARKAGASANLSNCS